MVPILRLYFDAAVGVAIMAVLGIISGFAAAGITNDRTSIILTAAAVFVLAGVALVFRLWRMTRKPATQVGQSN
jgi:hypothetical protein